MAIFHRRTAAAEAWGSAVATNCDADGLPVCDGPRTDLQVASVLVLTNGLEPLAAQLTENLGSRDAPSLRRSAQLAPLAGPGTPTWAPSPHASRASPPKLPMRTE